MRAINALTSQSSIRLHYISTHSWCLEEVCQYLPASCGKESYNRDAVLLPSALLIPRCIAALPKTATQFTALPGFGPFATRDMTDVVMLVIIDHESTAQSVNCYTGSHRWRSRECWLHEDCSWEVLKGTIIEFVIKACADANESVPANSLASLFTFNKSLNSQRGMQCSMYTHKILPDAARRSVFASSPLTVWKMSVESFFCHSQLHSLRMHKPTHTPIEILE